MRPEAYTKFSVLRPLVLAGAIAAMLASIGAAPARADDWDHGRGGWRGHERREHEWREHEWRERHGWGWAEPRYYYYGAPGYAVGPRYYYPPPAVVYPPPVYVPPAGLSLGFYFR